MSFEVCSVSFPIIILKIKIKNEIVIEKKHITLKTAFKTIINPQMNTLATDPQKYTKKGIYGGISLTVDAFFFVIIPIIIVINKRQ